jgi:hypothetical protein
MPPLGPISRRDMIRALRQAGFDGPYSGGKHSFMIKGDLTLTCRTRTKATSAGNCWRGFSGRRGNRSHPGEQ